MVADHPPGLAPPPPVSTSTPTRGVGDLPPVAHAEHLFCPLFHAPFSIAPPPAPLHTSTPFPTPTRPQLPRLRLFRSRSSRLPRPRAVESRNGPQLHSCGAAYFKSSNGGTAEKNSSLDEQQEKISELRKELGEHLSPAIQDFLSDASLSRFLRARNWNVQKASKMMKGAVKWRLAFKPENIFWEDIAQEAETGKIYRADYKDKHGRTVLVLRPGLENTTSATGQIKYLVYSLEKAIMNLPEDQEKMVWLTDFQCWTLGSTPLKVTRETVNVLQDCYPERLGLAILYNPPRIFESFWKIVKPFLDHETRKKVKFVYSNDKESQKIMAEVFDMEQLDSAFGGKNPATFEYNSYAERMQEDDKKMGSLHSSTDSLHGSVAKEANGADSDASSEASFYSGSESPKHEEGEDTVPRKNS
ncbi:hypothetical protein U9M48_020242 [Paspalum notatum var. saurae]|uniref:CRAL-TRIO domain-containing protein n=1 Tax=Paspalum notatum var. saurae TaxID=547442 RepID=A0AAQ3THM4_PASNO